MTKAGFSGADRRTALRYMVRLAVAVPGLPLLARAPGAVGAVPVAAAPAPAGPGMQTDTLDPVHLSGASVPTTMIAEWFTGDVNNTSGPFCIAAAKSAYDTAPANASRYEAKLYNFPGATLRTLTFRKGGPVQHLLTSETEIYVLRGSATLTPIPGHPGKPLRVSAGDALFLPSGYLNSAVATEDFVILQAFVSRTVREARKAIVTSRQAVASETAEWESGGRAVRVSTAEQIRKAPSHAQRVSTRRFAGDGNSIFEVTRVGGRSNISTRSGSDLLIYIVKGRARRMEGGQLFDLVPGDCAREKVGNSGYWEALEEVVYIATEAPLNPAMLPPSNT